MTRFARAKGSKSSNERLPEEPTPWHIMKERLEQSTSTPKTPPQKTKSAKELLKEKEDSLHYPTLQNSNTDWAEFGNPSIKKSTKIKRQGNFAVDTILTKKPKSDNQHVEANGANKQKNEPIDNLQENKVREKKKNKSPKIKHDTNEIDISENKDKKTSEKLSKRQKRNRKNRKVPSDDDGKEEKVMKVNEKDQTSSGMFNVTGNDWDNNLKFGKKNGMSQKNEENDNEDSKMINKDPKTNFRQFDNKFRSNKFNNKSNNNKFSNKNKFNNNIKLQPKRKIAKIRDDKEHKRRKPLSESSKVIINGMEIEIVQYDGFPVKKEDAERLKELREKMVMRGIPKSEIDAAMKLERRKAEKALARVRKNVCFHCRKAGHNLSDCPELGREEAATGICFKCGSTEHTHFECKVNKKDEFRYAMCFICREQGHIAKQCPDNPKGLYPQGGACKVCGDVTHLKKDCPDLAKEKEENTMRLDTIGESGVESLSDVKKESEVDVNSKSKNKVVKF